MGYYVDPPEGTKEEWLIDHGLEVTGDLKWGHPPETVLVCLVDNGPFTAAGICCNEAEFNKFREPDPTPEEVAASKARAEVVGIHTIQLDTGNQRPRKWYVVPRKDITNVCPEVAERLS